LQLQLDGAGGSAFVRLRLTSAPWDSIDRARESARAIERREWVWNLGRRRCRARSLRRSNHLATRTQWYCRRTITSGYQSWSLIIIKKPWLGFYDH
jgi:hypothetical protein